MNVLAMAASGVAGEYAWADVKVPFSISLPGVKDQTTYTAAGTTADIAGIIDNSYHFFAITDASSGGSIPAVAYFVRGRFLG